MRLKSLLIIRLLCLSLWLMAQSAYAQGWKKGKPGSWVRPDSIDYNLSIKSAEVDGGYYYSLVDEQTNVETKEYYSHFVYKIINDAGVQNASELYFDFNPAFQHLTIHSLKLYRNGKLVDRLESSTFKTLQRETDLERHLYDNTLSVFTVLPDVRAGDVIDYSYTVQGDNPIFEGKFHYSFSLSASYTLLKANQRIVRKKSTPLNIRYYKEERKPQVVEDGLNEEWTWNYTNLPRFESEDDIPSSYRVSPLVEVSSYFEWKDVIAWAKDVFKKDNSGQAAVTQKAKSIMAVYPGKKDRIIAALRFVQNQIRYYGLEIGTNAIKPHAPGNTLARRFGDCKDKAVLFCALLQEMGIDSCYPVLVHADKREEIAHYIPSASAFNHAIACVTLEGTRYFFDPTSAFEGGDFDHTYTALYGKGLIVDPASKGLEPVTPNLMSKTAAKETYDILDMSGKAKLTVTTTYYGTHADNERYRFANNSLNDIKQNYLDFYKKKYGELREADDLFYSDDTVSNKIVVTETYNIDCVWDTSGINDKRKEVSFCSDMVRDFTGRYSKSLGPMKLPLGLEHPFELEHHIEINLPDEWSVENSQDVFKTKYLAYTRDIAYADRRLSIHYSLRTLTDVCEATDAKTLYTQLDHIRDNNWYNIYHDTSLLKAEPAPKTKRFNWVLAFIFFMFLLFAGCAMAWVYNGRSQVPALVSATPRMPGPAPVKGIGGWLVAAVIGYGLGTFAFFYAIYTGHYFNASYWKDLTDFESSNYSPLWAPALIIELMCVVTGLAFDLLCLLLAFNHDRRFPKVAITRMIVVLCCNVTRLIFFIALKDHAPEGQLHTYVIGVVMTAVSCCLWIPYFIRSERVRNTFVN